MDYSCSVNEEHPSYGLFSKLANFNCFVGMPIMGVENEVMALLWKMEVRKIIIPFQEGWIKAPR